MLFSNCKLGTIDHGENLNSDFHDVRQPENNMSTKTGSTHIFKSVMDIVEIPTANLGFRPHRDPTNVTRHFHHPTSTGNS